MISRSYERIVSKVATNVRLNDFPADTIPRDEVFILTSRHFDNPEGQVSGSKVLRHNGSKWQQ